MVEEFHSHLKKFFPELLEQHVVVACSAGLDSVVLSHICAEVGLRFDLAHCNFQLRGSDSVGDAEFVKNLGKILNVKTHVKIFETKKYAQENKLSVQVAARELRYRWFDELLDETGAAYILTAHQADDQLETFLMNLGRGSGLKGLSGIPERNGRVLRPLLPFQKDRLGKFAKHRSILWREDASNATDAYLRNQIRHQVLPSLSRSMPNFLPAFLTSLEYLKGSRDLVENHLEQVRARVEKPGKGCLMFNLKELKGLDPLEPYLYELFSPYGFSDWMALRQLLDAIPGKEVRSPSHRLLRDRQALLLKARTGTGPDVRRPAQIKPQVGIYEGPLRLEISEVAQIDSTSPDILYVDKETLNKPMTLRKWKEGDYFYPLGMNARKRVSKFLKDLKLSRFEKEEQWVLLCGQDIVWIPGIRADERFKVTEKTRTIIKVRCLE